MTSQRVRRAGRIVALAVAAVAAASVQTAAWAHAALVATEPGDRAVVDAAPERLTLTFNEAVSVPTGGIRVFDADARRVDTGPIARPGDETVVVSLPGLDEGGYVVTWRVVSDDSHPVAGVFTFQVGDAPAVDDALVAELFGGAGPTTTGTIGPVARAVAYAGTLVAAGAALAGWWFATTAAHWAAARRVVVAGAVAGVTASLAAVVVQAAALTGALGDALAAGVLAEVLASGFGQGTLVRVVWLPAVAVLATRRAPPWAQGVSGAIAAASFALDGHQRVTDPVWLVAGADVVHLVAAAVWVGGLVVVARFATDMEVPLRRFSRAAIFSVGLLVVSGLVMATVLVRAPRALDTPYGWTLIAKLAVVVVVVGIAANNRWRLVPRVVAGDAALAARLRRAMRIETVLLAGVLVISGVLATQPPAAQLAGVDAAFHTVVALDDAHELELVVDPNRVGLNALHLYVFDETGRPAAEIDDLVLELTYVPEQIGPITIEPFFAGPGHWIANVDDLRFAGEWRIDVVVGIGRFTEAQAEVTVHVNP